MTISGECLCGQVKVQVASDHQEQIACHCKDCVKSSGSAHSVNILPKQSDVKITGPTGQYDMKAPSGNTVSRIFCKNCGAAIAHKSAAFGEAMALQTGIMNNHFANVPIKTELFVKDRWSGLPAIDGAAQVQAMP